MPGAELYEIHFFPDRNELEVRRKDGTVVEKFPAKGGDPTMAGSPGGWELTNSGTFFITRIEKHRSGGRWPLSQYTWGETVRLDINTRGVFGWGKTTPDFTLSEDDFNNFYANHPAVLKARRSGAGFVFVPYYINDFGHITIKMAPDSNNNGILDPDERGKMSAHFMHTTPDSELAKMLGAEDTYILDYSHGCIHVKPSDIDTLIAKYITVDTTKVVIYPY